MVREKILQAIIFSLILLRLLWQITFFNKSGQFALAEKMYFGGWCPYLLQCTFPMKLQVHHLKQFLNTKKIKWHSLCAREFKLREPMDYSPLFFPTPTYSPRSKNLLLNYSCSCRAKVYDSIHIFSEFRIEINLILNSLYFSTPRCLD